MATTDWRETQRQQRLEQVLTAAEDLVEAAGVESLTLHRLGKELGMSAAALYRYFDSKADLFVTLQLRMIEQYRVELGAIYRELDDASPLTRAVAVGQFYAEVAATDRRRFALASDVLGNPRQLLSNEEAAPLVPPLLALLAEVATPLVEAADAGQLEPGDASVRAVTLLSTLHGLLQLAKLTRLAPALDPAQHVEGFLRTLFRGWGASADDLDTAFATLPDTLTGLAAQAD